jgi:hypothetical protein
MVTVTSGPLKGFSRAIAQPVVAVLVGAGVSKGLGFPLMGGEDYEDLRDQFLQDLEGRGCGQILDRVSLPNPRQPNLEDIFEQIRLIVRSARTLRNCPGGCSMASEAEEADELIERFVAERYAFPQEQSARAVHLYATLLDAIWPATDGGLLPVFTTNYDLAIESYWLGQQRLCDLIRGFEVPGTNEWDATCLHRVVPSFPKPTIVLMKLHGSTGWMLNGANRPVVALPLGVPELLDSVKNHAIVAPVRTKAPDGEPYLTYFAYLEECAANATGLVVLGYAFGELGVRNAIRTGLARRRGLPLRVLLVDKNPSAVDSALSEVAPPFTALLRSVRHDFSDDPLKLALQLRAWLSQLPEFVDRMQTSTPSARWDIRDSDPPGMVEAAEEGVTVQWDGGARYEEPGYWEWRECIEHYGFTVSFEVCPEGIGYGWYPGLQLLDEHGENVVSLVVAGGRSAVNSGFDVPALATVLGSDGFGRRSGWGRGVVAGRWVRASLEVLGRQCRAFIGDEWSERLGLHAQPWRLRIGAVGRDPQVGPDSMGPGRCLLRNLQLRTSMRP